MTSLANGKTQRRRVAGERSRAAAPAPAAQPKRWGRSAPAAPAAKAADRGAAEAARPARASSGQPEPSGATDRGPLATFVPLIALCLSLAVFASVLAVTLRAPAGQISRTDAATAQAKTSLEQMLSFNYETFDADTARMQNLLTGPFRTEFSTTMTSQIKPLAVKNKSVVKAQVYQVGVMSSSDSQIKVLAYVNQAKTSSDLDRPAIDQNRVIATLTKANDRWLISRLEAF